MTRGATDDDKVDNLDGMVKHSEGVMPSATRSTARGRTSFMVAMLLIVVDSNIAV